MGGLSLHATVVATVMAIAFLAVVFELVRRHYLQERYSVVWVITGVTMLIGVAVSGSFDALARLTGIHDTSIALLSLLIFFLLVMVLHLTTAVSRLSEENTRLAQEIAILQLRQGSVEARVPPEEGEGHPYAGVQRPPYAGVEHAS
jgi:hypothetical protein